MGKLFYKNFEIPYSELKQFIDVLNSGKLEKWEKDFFDFAEQWLSESVDYITTSTSGSTGKPKMINISKVDMIKSAEFTIDFLELTKNNKALLCLPVNFIGGKMMLVRALVGDFDLQIVKPVSDPISDFYSPVDFIALTPHQLQKSLENGKTEILQDIKTIIIGGGGLFKTAKEEISDWTNKVYSTYGMTECISHIAMTKLSQNSSNQTYSLINDRFKISIDHRGCLIINTPYQHAKELITNDVVEIINEKDFFWYGRVDNVINSAGIKIHPEVVENQLQNIIKNNFFLAGVSDPEYVEKLVLIIEGDINTSMTELKNEISQIVENKFHVPKEILFVPKFIYTENNKINRKRTLDMIK